VSVLLAVVFLFQDKSAEETLMKLDQSLESAKSLSLDFRTETRIQFDDHEEKTSLSGKILVKDGNRARMELKRMRSGEEMSTVHVSNGSRVADSRAEETVVAPKHYVRNFVIAALSRTGITEAYLTTFSASRPEDYDVRMKFVLSKVRTESDEGDLKSLSYTMAFGEHESFVHLWYDPKSLLPVKRTLIAKVSKATLTTTEVYENYAANASIPDDKFVLPAEK